VWSVETGNVKSGHDGVKDIYILNKGVKEMVVGVQT
jgi:hypothetical protein